ncbi:MAG: hypothetical protein DRR19_15800 [Candidatus Parabeggiatoa sp. nov. 1]|nr:MAG: hypothetical protein DRR19_15800 [Gammaproteobacteria bacterium]
MGAHNSKNTMISKLSSPTIVEQKIELKRDLEISLYCNYSAPKVRIIIAWGFAAGTGVYDCEKGVALGFNKAPFQG